MAAPPLGAVWIRRHGRVRVVCLATAADAPSWGATAGFDRTRVMERISVKSVIIIGAGLGGLAAALRLRHMGFDVTVIEKQRRPGGRSNVLQEHGFRVDIGPTILVMKQTFDETYRAIGQDLNQRVKFVPLTRTIASTTTTAPTSTSSTAWRSWPPSASASSRASPRGCSASSARAQRSMSWAWISWRATMTTSRIWRIPGRSVRLVETGSYQKLYAQACRFFKTDKLRKAFTFHSMFLGLSPFDALAMYSLITYADLVEGMQYPMGGIYSIVEDMVALAGEMGVTLRTGTPVEEILIDGGRAKGVRLAGGEIMSADIVVSNAELVYTYKQCQ